VFVVMALSGCKAQAAVNEDGSPLENNKKRGLLNNENFFYRAVFRVLAFRGQGVRG
jgi:hypothetical protein